MTFRVLIADDQRVVRAILRSAAQAHQDLEVCDDEAENGREAIDLVVSQSPDAIILDYEMPELDGLEALPAIRTALPGGLVVMYSSNESPEMATAAVEAGADAYLCKGERTPTEVVALIADTLASRKPS